MAYERTKVVRFFSLYSNDEGSGKLMAKRIKSNHCDAPTVKIDVMSSDDEQIKIRLEPVLTAAIRASAKQHERSITAEVAARLRMSYDLEDAVHSGFGRPLGLTEAEIVRMIDRRVRLVLKQGGSSEV